MAIYNAAGAALSKTGLQALTTAVPSTEVTVSENIYQSYTHESSTRFEDGYRLVFAAGQRVEQADVDALFPAATVTGIDPTSGPAAGGTAVTIQGTNLAGVTGVTIGGAAATGVTVDSDTRVSATTPAGTAGAKDVVVADDAGSVTLTGGFTYV